MEFRRSQHRQAFHHILLCFFFGIVVERNKTNEPWNTGREYDAKPMEGRAFIKGSVIFLPLLACFWKTTNLGYTKLIKRMIYYVSVVNRNPSCSAQLGPGDGTGGNHFFCGRSTAVYIEHLSISTRIRNSTSTTECNTAQADKSVG